MAVDESSGDLVDEIATEFLERKQRGESPSITEYCVAHPLHADEIRSLLRTLELVDGVQGPSANSDEPLASHKMPERVGQYEILGEIGRGGMGVVYRARHHALGRVVALKVLARAHSHRGNLLERFRREARTVAKMHHTNIVPVFEVGEAERQIFLAMQLIHGASLDRVVADLSAETSRADGELRDDNSQPHAAWVRSDDRQHPEDVDSSDGGWDSSSSAGLRALETRGLARSGPESRSRSVARIGVQAADALHYAHQRGIVHRDVKPSNLILDRRGIVWLTDFGLAKTDDEELTQTGEFVGTLRYMAPERFYGECDARSDVYGLGLTLYELLTLRPAYPSTDRLRIIEAITREDPPPPRQVDPRVARDLETIILKASDRDPASRYDSAAELAEDLRRFINDDPIAARRTPLVERVMRWCRRNKGLAASFGAIAVLTIALAVGSSITAVYFRQGQRVQARLAGENERNLYAAHMNLAGHAMNEPSGYVRVAHFSSRWLPDKVGVDLRGWEWYYLTARLRRERFTLPSRQQVTAVAWSPDGRWLASAENAPDGVAPIRLWETENGQPIRVISTRSSSVRALAWSPSGRLLASVGSDGTIVAWDVESGREMVACPSPAATSSVCWSPDGARLASGGRNDTVRVWDARTGDESARLGPAGPCVRWSPDGKLIATPLERVVSVWDVDGGTERHNLKVSEMANSVCFSPDGKHLAAAGWGKLIRIWHVEDASPLLTLEGHTGTVTSIAWSPGDDLLASVGHDQSVRIWSTTGGEQSQILAGHQDRIGGVCWSPDGKRLATSSLDRTVKVWDLNQPNGNLTLTRQKNYVSSMGWSPDGTRLAATFESGPGIVLDAAGRAPTSRFLDRYSRSVCWSADGALLAVGDRQGKIHVLDAGSRRTVHSWQAHGEDELVTCVDWSPDGKLLASAVRDGSIKVWRVSDRREVFHRKGSFHHVRWSPDGSRLVFGGDDAGWIELFDADTWRSTHRIQGHRDRVRGLCWHPDGKRFASASADYQVKIWDADSGQLVHSLSGHSDRVFTVAWSPDGARIASAGADQMVRIWDAERGVELLAIPGHTHEIWSVCWSPEGKRIASAGRSVRIWDATLGYTARDAEEN